jgi:RNA polymerase sporulation-specific sigma factor
MRSVESLENIEPLVLLARSGDIAAFAKLFAAFRPLVFRMARSYFAPGNDLDDLLQEATIGFYGAIRNFRAGRGTFRAFVSLCVQRRLLTLVRSATGGKHRLLNNALSLDRAAYDDDLGGALIDRLVVNNTPFPVPDVPDCDEFLAMLISRCSPLERHVLKMQSAGYTAKEIASDCGINEKSANNAQWRVLMKARRMLSEGFEPTSAAS